jgi:DNA sulfur modification protein DndD
LKDVDIVVARDAVRNVTVIRAANESGKTTMLVGLQWGLFGDVCLPEKGRSFRLHPLDTSMEPGTRVEISVSVDYEVPGKPGPKTYRVVRSAVESVSGEAFTRESTTVQLYLLTREGANSLEHPEAYLRPHLPLELREILFTDGDRALSFIEGTRGEQSRRVEGAIRSLLGLNVVEDAIKHVGTVSSQLNRKVKTVGGGHDLSGKGDRLVALKEELIDREKRKTNLHKEVLNLEDLARDADQRLRNALRGGNRDEIAAELERLSKSWDKAEKTVLQASREQADLFRSETLAKQLLQPAIEQAKNVLDSLHEQGKIPNQTIPVLEDRLEQANCICGESLDVRQSEGRQRREHIKQLIEASKNSDALQEVVTALYYGARGLMAPTTENGWIGEYSTVYERRQNAISNLADLGKRSKVLEKKISDLPNIDIRQLQEQRDVFYKDHLTAARKEVELEAEIRSKKETIADLQQSMEILLNADVKGRQLKAELDVASDLESILSASLTIPE